MEELKNNITILIDKRYSGISIKEFFQKIYLGKTKAYLFGQNKQIYVNDQITQDSYILKVNDKLTITLDEKIDFPIWKKNIDILYEDDFILICNKPNGILIHPDSEDNQYTLVNIIAYYYQEKDISRNIRYIHRIDKETSGIVVFAKDPLTEAILSHQIETHEIKREYLAICHNALNKLNGVINEPIGRDRHNSNKYRVGKSKNSKDAVTYYDLVKNYGKNKALIHCVLKTGRTHQIRVHLAYQKHPLYGDSLYGQEDKCIKRVALHSYRVTIDHPFIKKKIIVECPLPEDMKKILKS